MSTVLTWYLAMQLMAFAAWPIAFSVCHRLPDRGYGLAKGLGLLLVTYITWAVAHLGGRWPGLGFSFSSVSTAWAAMGVVALVSLARRGGEMLHFLRRRSGYIFRLELVMLAAFFAMIALRAEVPHISYFVANPTPDSLIDHAAEKFMDFAVINGLLTSSAFPPHDMWVSGLSLNYYYFGHMMWAVLIKFCSVRPEVGFNLALASAFSLACTLAFAVGYNLTSRKRWGLMTLFLVCLGSNLDGFWQLVGAIKGAVFMNAEEAIWYANTGPWWGNYDFWRSSRAVENTITEFPAFSFLLGDLHAHLSALVLMLCGWNVAIQVFRSARQYGSLWRYAVNSFDELFIAALIMGALSATNSWDVPVFAGVVALALWSGSTGRRDPYAYVSGAARMAARGGGAVGALLVTAVVAALGVGLLFYPFLRNFSAPAPEEGALIKLVDPSNRSSPFEFFAHWIMLAGLPAAALIMITWRRRTLKSLALGEAPVVEGPSRAFSIKSLALTAVVLAAGFVLVPLWQGWVAVLMGAATVLISGLLIGRHLPPLSRWLCGLVVLFCLLTWFCELFYVDDIFSGNIERINTVFKTYYGLWPLMAVATVMAMRLLIAAAPDSMKRRRALWLVLPLVVLGTPYMIFGTINRITSATRLGHYTPPEDAPRTKPRSPLLRKEARPENLGEALDGLRYMTFIHPDDYAAAMWIRTNLPPDAILLEAAGSQYGYSGRMSTITGRPAFAGWLSHAWGWRGHSFADELTRRTNRAAEIYAARDPQKAAEMLHAENISYVVVGSQEQAQYPAMDEGKFSRIGRRVYSHGNTNVYRVETPVGAKTPAP